MTELSRQLIAEAARAHARNRQTAAGDDQRLGLHGADLVCRNVKAAIIVLDLRNRASGFDPHANRGTLVEQHPHDLLRRLVAEQLAEFFLVPGDAVALAQRQALPLRLAPRRPFETMRLSR